MRILFIALRLPYSVRSGHALILHNYLRYLGAQHEVDLVAFGEGEHGHLAELKRLCSHVEMVSPPGAFARRCTKAIGLFSRRPLRVSYYASVRMRRTVEALVHERRYDAIVVQLYEAAQFCPTDFSGPVILDLEDPPSVKLARTRPWLGWWQRMLSDIDRRRIIAYERICARQFDRLVFVNARDAADFGVMFGCEDKVRHVVHGVEVPGGDVTGSADRVSGMAIVTGNMGHPPNVAAVDFICREVFPKVREAVPDATLWIVGAGPSKVVRDHGKINSVRVTGAVPDVRQYLEQARVAICGVTVVVGTQTKILEALACGTPVVTTSAGNHGIEGVSGEHLHVSDDPDELAASIISLLKDEGWMAMSQAGRRLVMDRFTWSHTGAALERVISEAIAERQSASPQ
jgi:glycosyltransferase involved in cell wall biosynthesis